MGAYYTKEDITGYICRNTIIPALFDKANLTLDLLDLPKTIESYLYPALKQIDRLPTETDREYDARQKRVQKLIADARQGAIATINDAITAMKQDGTLAGLHKKWLGVDPDPDTSTVTVLDIPQAQ